MFDEEVIIDSPNNGWCHLAAKNVEVLHAFAAKIGLKRHWFQNHRVKNQPHYDVTGVMIDHAIVYGARAVRNSYLFNYLKHHYGKDKGVKNKK